MYVCMKVEIAAKMHVGYHGGSTYAVPSEDDLKQVYCIYMYVYMYVYCMYVCYMYVCMHVCTVRCMYVYVPGSLSCMYC